MNRRKGCKVRNDDVDVGVGWVGRGCDAMTRRMERNEEDGRVESKAAVTNFVFMFAARKKLKF